MLPVGFAMVTERYVQNCGANQTAEGAMAPVSSFQLLLKELDGSVIQQNTFNHAMFVVELARGQSHSGDHSAELIHQSSC